MFQKTRYTPVADEQVIPCDHTMDECWDLLMQWCDQSRNGLERAQNGLVFMPTNELEFRAYAQFDSRENTRDYYYKTYCLRIWLTQRADGGCDIHYQRMYDTWRGSMMRPMGGFIIVAAIIWLMLTWNSEQAWVFMLFLIMVGAGVLMIFAKIEKPEQGLSAGDLLQEAIAKADWQKE